MSQLIKGKHLYAILFVVICALFYLACVPEMEDVKTKDKAKQTPAAFKKPAKTPTPVPVFQVQAEITTADGIVYPVEGFTFYSEQREFEGGIYHPNSGSKNWPLYIKQGPIWRRFQFADVKSLTLKENKTHDWLEADLVKMDGARVQGLFPMYAYKSTWLRYGTIYLTGRGGGTFKCFSRHVYSLNRNDGGVGDKPKFRTVYGQFEKKQATVVNPIFKAIWKDETPNYLSIYRMQSDMPIIVGNREIKIKPQNIESVTVLEEELPLCLLKKKNGETVKAELPARVFGYLKNGDVLFSHLFEKGKPVIKQILIK